MKIGNIMLSPLALLYLPAAILRDASASAAASSRPKVLGRLYGRLELPDGRPLNYTAKIVLNHGEIVAYSRSDGSFAVERVPPGIHVLDVHDPVYHFSQFKIQLLADDVDNPSILEYYYPGATKQPRSLPIVWTPLATYDYFEHRSGFSLFGLLRSPMLLFMLFSAGMMFLLPKLMEQMEPEEKERMRKQMAMQSNPTEMFSQIMSGDWSSLGGEDPQSQQQQQPKHPSSAASSPSKKKGGKK